MSNVSQITVASLVQILEKLAPQKLAEPWDQVGLQWGQTDWPVKKAFLCIDLTEPVLEEAIRASANFIVSYHPPMFKPLARVTEANWKSRLALKAIQAKMAVYSPHTSLDSVQGGVNDWLASMIQAQDDAKVTAIDPWSGNGLKDAKELKLVTFVPEAQLEAVRKAMAGAGAGQIGAYSECSFSLKGTGSFKGGDGTDPAVGQQGKFETVEELRLEMVVPAHRLEPVLSALMLAHPYEEVAYDLYPLKVLQQSNSPVGTGRQLTFSKPIAISEIIARIRAGLDMPAPPKPAGDAIPKPWGSLAIVPPIDQGVPADIQIQTVAICAGAGYSVIKNAKADLYFTGEMRHHDQLEMAQCSKWTLLAGHTETERPYLKVLAERLANMTDGVNWQVSTQDSGIMREI